MEKAADDASFYLTGTHKLQPRPVEPVELTKPLVKKLKKLVRTKTATSYWNNFDSYSADLDGDGSKEIIVQATSAISDVDESFSFSVIAILAPRGKALSVGYIARGDSAEDAHLAGLEGIADMNGDGTMEIIVSHDEPWIHYHPHTVYEWTGKALRPYTEFNWVERDCYPEVEWPSGAKTAPAPSR